MYNEQSKRIKDSNMFVMTHLFQQEFCLFLLKKKVGEKID